MSENQRRPRRWLPLFLAAALLACVGPALAGRNGSGTFTLAAGNPVLTLTTISSTWANSTLSDIATELTNSLDRQGRGGMVAQLNLQNGSLGFGTLGLGFSSDLGTGLWLDGTHTIGVAISGQRNSDFNVNGLTVNGLGSTASVRGVALSTGSGVEGDGNGSTAGVVGVGGASGAGVVGTGGASGAGGNFAGGLVGVIGTGGAGFAGGSFANGTASTASVYQDALAATNGALALNGLSPNINVGFANRLTPKNIVKAWAFIDDTAGSVSVLDGFNICTSTGGGCTAPATSSTTITLSFASAMANSTYAVIPTIPGESSQTSCMVAQPDSRATGNFAIQAWGWSGAGGNFSKLNWSAGSCRLMVWVIGSQ